MTGRTDVNRKVDAKGEPTDEVDDDGDPRPDLDHYPPDTSDITDRLSLPTLPDTTVLLDAVVVSLYVFIVAGALSFGYGVTSLSYRLLGLQGAFVVGGVFTAAYSYVAVAVITELRGGEAREPTT